MKNLYRSSFLVMIFFALSNFSLNAQCFIATDSVFVDCDFNDTPLDPSDDLLTFDVLIFGDTINGSGSWTASDGSSGPYNTVVTYGPYEVTEGDVSLTFTDVDFPDCNTTLVVPATSCEFTCTLGAYALNVLCDDNGTPADLADDLFTFEAQVTGANVGESWTASDGTTGAYGENVTFGPYPAADGAVSLIFTDDLYPDLCPDTIEVAPPNCIDDCQIIATNGPMVCDDAGTPQDPSDDTFTKDFFVSGSFTSSTEWFANDPNNTTGTFNQTTTFGPYDISDGWVSFSIRDVGNPQCFDSIWIAPPAPCSDDYIDLSLFKWVTPSVAEPGETVTFHLDVVNFGPDEVTGLEITDYLPDGYESISNITDGGVFDGNQIVWSNLEIMAGDSIATVSFDAVVAANGDYLNSAEITAVDQFDIDSTPGNGVDTDGDGNCANDLDDEDDGACAGIISCSNSDLTSIAGPDLSLGCDIFNVVSIDGEADGGTPPYTFRWLEEDGSLYWSFANVSFTDPGVFILEVTDAIGCKATDTVEIIQLEGTVAEAGPNQTIDCNTPTVTLDGSGSSQGANFSYEWSGPGDFVSTDLVLEVSISGWYTLTVVNEQEPDCSASDWVYVYEENLEPGLDYQYITCEEIEVFSLYFDSIQFLDHIWTFPDGSTSEENSISTTHTGYHYLEISSSESGCSGLDSIYIEVDSENCATLHGHVFWDTEPNCELDTDENGLPDRMVRISNDENTFYKITDANGDFSISLELGTYTVEVLIYNDIWFACVEEYTVDLTTPGDAPILSIPVQKADECPSMTVDISAFWLRTCRDNTYWVEYCNYGTANAEDAYVTVQIDPSLTYSSSSIPLASQEGNLLTFELGDVPTNDCDYFTIDLFIDCEAELGQTHCAEAHIYPDTLCLPPAASWSGASIQVGADCEEEDVQFIIENTGESDMLEPSSFIVIEDGVMMIVAPGEVQLESEEKFMFSMPANGTSYRLEADQVPNHPGFSMPSVSVEGCGENEDGTFSTGFVSLFPMDDQDQFIDVECRENNGPYDPNDKTGFPRGFGEEHYIHTNTDLEYLIRFQNVGTDTAFNVVIRDTISPYLDITTLRPGVSSHDYTWDIDKGNAVVFTFENIMLPDSNVNLEGSQGFIRFNIKQVRDLPLETVIENSAAIYFDFNEPVITNTTWHTIGDDFLEVVNFVAGPTIEPDALKVYPNPVKNVATFQLENWQGDQVGLQLYDVHGRVLLSDRFNGNTYELKRRSLPAGLYFFRLESNGDLIGTGKLMME